MLTANKQLLNTLFTRSSERRAGSSIITYSSKLPADVQQTSCKFPANVEQLAPVFWIHLLEVCWTFAGSCKRGITAIVEANIKWKYIRNKERMHELNTKAKLVFALYRPCLYFIYVIAAVCCRFFSTSAQVCYRPAASDYNEYYRLTVMVFMAGSSTSWRRRRKSGYQPTCWNGSYPSMTGLPTYFDFWASPLTVPNLESFRNRDILWPCMCDPF